MGGILKPHDSGKKGICIGNPKFMACDDWELEYINMLENTSVIQLYIRWVYLTFFL